MLFLQKLVPVLIDRRKRSSDSVSKSKITRGTLKYQTKVKRHGLPGTSDDYPGESIYGTQRKQFDGHWSAPESAAFRRYVPSADSLPQTELCGNSKHSDIKAITITKLENELKQCKSQIQEKDRVIACLQKDVQELGKQNNDLRNNKTYQEQEVKKLKSIIDELKKTIHSAERQFQRSRPESISREKSDDRQRKYYLQNESEELEELTTKIKILKKEMEREKLCNKTEVKELKQELEQEVGKHEQEINELRIQFNKQLLLQRTEERHVVEKEAREKLDKADSDLLEAKRECKEAQTR